MKKAKEVSISFVIASGMLFLQYTWMPGVFLNHPEPNTSLFTAALIFGLIFSFAGCPGCALPLSISLSPWHNRPLKTVIPMLIFHGGRMLSIFTYAIILASGLTMLKTMYLRYSFVLSGIIMIVFSLVILREFPITGYPGKSIGKFTSLYALWGIIFGVPCGFEATGFLTALWAWSDTLSKTIVSSFLFTAAAIIPIMVFSYLILMGIGGLSRFFSRLHPYIRSTCAFYLFLLGSFIIIRSFP